MNFLKDLQWRYATKAYDPNRKISEDDLHTIVEATRLTPTSSGLEQFRVMVIEDPELKEKIVPIAWGQQIVKDCSHLMVFVAWDKYTAERIDSMLDYTALERNLPADRYEAYAQRLKDAYLNQTPEENFVHTSKQAYIGLGFAMAQAAILKIDSTPMEGFSPDELDELLGLRAKGYRSVLLLPLGYRDPEHDWLAPMKKVRVPMDEFVIK